MSFIDIVFNTSSKVNIFTAVPEDTKILCVGYLLQIGDISHDIHGRHRERHLKSFFGYDKDMREECKETLKEVRNDFEEFRKEVKNSAAFRVWRDLHNAENLCGFAFFCDQLVGSECTVMAVEAPEDAYIWPPFNGEEFEASYSETVVTCDEIARYAALWQQLKRENASLRTVVDGRLCTADETCCDHAIMDNIPSDEPVFENDYLRSLIPLHMLSSRVSYWWYAHRLDRFVKTGELESLKYETTEEAQRYGRLLKKPSFREYSWETLRLIAEKTVGCSVLWMHEYLPSPLVYVLLSSKNNLYIINDDDVKAMKRMLKKAHDTVIVMWVTMWENGTLDLPSAAAREALLKLSGKNADTQLKLSNGVRTIGDCMP